MTASVMSYDLCMIFAPVFCLRVLLFVSKQSNMRHFFIQLTELWWFCVQAYEKCADQMHKKNVAYISVLCPCRPYVKTSKIFKRRPTFKPLTHNLFSVVSPQAPSKDNEQTLWFHAYLGASV